MFQRVFTGLCVMTVFASSALASPEITCRYDGIPNGSWPDKGPDRSDMFKFANVGGAGKTYAFWTPFVNSGGETRPLVNDLQFPLNFDLQCA